MTDAEVVLSPGDVARRLGVSPSGLRRLAVIYGEVHGELQKDAGGTSRIWPREAVTRLEAARALMTAGQARSIKDALEAVERGAQPAVEAALALNQEGRMAEALGVVAMRLEVLQHSNERLEAEVAALRSEVTMLKALPTSERAATVEEGQRGKSPGVGSGAAQSQPDGPMVRAVRWIKQRLRGGRR